MIASGTMANRVEERLLERNKLFEEFFSSQALRLAEASREMAERFAKGGRLLAFGRGSHATDAQHVSVEFVHPVIVGKRALPALDLSAAFLPWLESILKPEDMVMGIGGPEGDPQIEAALYHARERRAMTLALPGGEGSYSFRSPTADPFLHQELVEILYHTLWESVHVFFEHRTVGRDAGASSFLYPFLGDDSQDTEGVLASVARSIEMKVSDDAVLRAQVAEQQASAVAETATAMRERIARGGKLLLFGNGGSATDANDWAHDCIDPPNGLSSVPAISLSAEAATITAMANDLGVEVIFLRQLIAHAAPDDIAIAISTSGGSRDVIAALEEARQRGLLSVGLLGYDGGEIVRRGLCDHALIVRSDYIPRIQEVQASIYHTIRELLEDRHA